MMYTTLFVNVASAAAWKFPTLTKLLYVFIVD